MTSCLSILQIFDGMYDKMNLLEKLCRYTVPRRIKSTGHILAIHFVTDSYIGGSGFKLSYYQGTIKELREVI